MVMGSVQVWHIPLLQKGVTGSPALSTCTKMVQNGEERSK